MDEEGPKHKCTVVIQQPLFPLCAWNVPGMVIVKQSTHYPRHVLSGNISTWNIIAQAVWETSQKLLQFFWSSQTLP